MRVGLDPSTGLFTISRLADTTIETRADDVFYRVVPGLTFEVCQSGKLTPEVERAFVEAILWLVNEHHVSAITGDCGFMMYFQKLARRNCDLPVFMSALAQVCAARIEPPPLLIVPALVTDCMCACVTVCRLKLPSITCAYQRHELIAIFTANAKSLEPMEDLLHEESGTGM